MARRRVRDAIANRGAILFDVASYIRRLAVTEISAMGVTVRLYATDEVLPGRASTELRTQSAATRTGAVQAFVDGSGVWQHVALGTTSLDPQRTMGREIVTVYVDDPSMRGYQEQLAARRNARDSGWGGVRPIVGLVEGPIFLPDGTVA